MAFRTLDPASIERLIKLSENPYRPPAILALQEEIEAATRVGVLRTTVTGKIDMEEVQRIVAMKLQLDGLYGAWAEGKIE